jgi:hypothetical protein
MTIWLLVLWGPYVAAVLGATMIRFFALRAVPRLGARVAALTALAGALPALTIMLMPVVWFWIPPVMRPLDLGFRSTLPLALGVVAVILLGIPPTGSHVPSAADVSRRTVFTFLRARGVVTLLGLSAVAVGLAVAAGLSSRLDEHGHFTEFSMSVGSSGSMRIGTSIYGWFYSVPGFVALGVLLIITAVMWSLIPRRPWAGDVEQDREVRTLRAANIGRAACGAVLIHLSEILRSLGGTLQLRGETGTTELGTVSVGAPLAAFGPVLEWAAFAALAVGLALWILIALTAIPRRPAGIDDASRR